MESGDRLQQDQRGMQALLRRANGEEAERDGFSALLKRISPNASGGFDRRSEGLEEATACIR
jgi:hypothetical protein